MLGAEQRAKDGVGRHADATQSRPFEFPPEVQHLDVQVFNLEQGNGELDSDHQKECRSPPPV